MFSIATAPQPPRRIMKELLLIAVAPIVIFILVVVGMVLVSRGKHSTVLSLRGLGLSVRFEAHRTERKDPR